MVLGKNIVVVMACMAFSLTRPAAPGAALVFVLGLALASFLEYGYHRCVLHRRAFGFLWRHHVEHHRAFPGDERVDAGDPRVEHLVEHPAVFPVAFAIVFAALSLFGVAYRELLLALSIQYGLFELAHWGTHVRDNPMDAVLFRIPVLNELRTRMIEHHLAHHRRPDGDYSVIPPYGPDRVFGTKR